MEGAIWHGDWPWLSWLSWRNWIGTMHWVQEELCPHLEGFIWVLLSTFIFSNKGEKAIEDKCDNLPSKKQNKAKTKHHFYGFGSLGWPEKEREGHCNYQLGYLYKQRLQWLCLYYFNIFFSLIFLLIYMKNTVILHSGMNKCHLDLIH